MNGIAKHALRVDELHMCIGSVSTYTFLLACATLLSPTRSFLRITESGPDHERHSKSSPSARV